MEQKKCSQTVPGEGQWGWLHKHKCTRNAKVEREDKPYCTIHDPEYIAEKNRKQQEKWDFKNAINSAKWARKRAIESFCEGVSTEAIAALVANKETLENWLKEK